RKRRDIETRVLAQTLIEDDDPQSIEQLALVFVDALDLAIENRVRIDGDICVPFDPVGEARLALVLAPLNARKERRVLRQRSKLLQLRKVRDPAVANRRRNRSREPGIGELQPASRRDTVRLVVEALRKDLCEILDRR